MAGADALGGATIQISSDKVFATASSTASPRDGCVVVGEEIRISRAYGEAPRGATVAAETACGISATSTVILESQLSVLVNPNRLIIGRSGQPTNPGISLGKV